VIRSHQNLALDKSNFGFINAASAFSIINSSIDTYLIPIPDKILMTVKVEENGAIATETARRIKQFIAKNFFMRFSIYFLNIEGKLINWALFWVNLINKDTLEKI
jgi:hypothetical protein